MKHQVEIPAPQVGIRMVATEAPGLTRKDLLKLWDDLGNEAVAETEQGIVVVDALIEAESAPGDLVWACDHCGAYSRFRHVVEQHERICGEQPSV